ncbi:hypothetical protein N9V90_00085 [Endozoicomonas sp.]|nr:hypothetical protein [Endozoicomonas sp.]
MSSLIFAVALGTIVIFGARAVDRMTTALIGGMTAIVFAGVGMVIFCILTPVIMAWQKQAPDRLSGNGW